MQGLIQDKGPVSQIGILGYGSFFLGYWDITCFKLGYWDIHSQIWDIALMSISGQKYTVIQVSLTRFGILGFGPYEIGILGYGSPEIGIFWIPGPLLTGPYSCK